VYSAIQLATLDWLYVTYSPGPDLIQSASSKLADAYVTAN